MIVSRRPVLLVCCPGARFREISAQVQGGHRQRMRIHITWPKQNTTNHELTHPPSHQVLWPRCAITTTTLSIVTRSLTWNPHLDNSKHRQIQIRTTFNYQIYSLFLLLPYFVFVGICYFGVLVQCWYNFRTDDTSTCKKPVIIFVFLYIKSCNVFNRWFRRSRYTFHRFQSLTLPVENCDQNELNWQFNGHACN